MLPKRLCSPKIVYTICLVNEGNLPITVMFVILKVSMKWCLFDSILFNEIPMGWLLAVESRSKTFNTTCVLFWSLFAWKSHGTLLERYFKLLGLMQYSFWALKDKNIVLVTTCLHLLYLVPPHDLQQPFFFSRGATFALIRMSFKFFTFLNPIIGIFSRAFPCSL